MDRLTPLNAFVQAAEARSFTAAGRNLGISSSAVGKSIMRLEERLGVRLFHRSTRSITLTAEGEAFLRRCQRIFEEIEAAEQELAQSTAAPRGRLKLSLPLVGMLLTPALSDFARAFPEVELELDFTDRLVDVINEGYDAVLRTGEARDSQLLTRKLGHYSYRIVASPNYLARMGTPAIPEDLLGHRCLRHRWSTTGKLQEWHLSREGKKIDLSPPASVVSTTVEPLIDMAARGVGLACLPIFAVRSRLETGELVSVLDEYPDETSTLRILWPTGRQLLPKVRAFIDFMSEELESEFSREPNG